MKNAKTETIGHAVVCQFCGQGFSLPVPIVGQPLQKRLQEFGQKLSQHIAKQHPDKAPHLAAQLQYLMGALVGYMCFAGFAVYDQELLNQAEEARRFVKHAVMGPVPTDEMLEAKARKCTQDSDVSHLGMDNDLLYVGVSALLKELRDVMQEKITEPPSQPEQKLVVES